MKLRNTLENIVLLAIVLVLVQTLLEDLATLLDWSVSVRSTLLVLGFAFDVFFTIEFVARSYDAYRRRRLWGYIRYERGWIDLLASVPLLVLNSGPAFLALMSGGLAVSGFGGVLNVLKVVKAIRIARVLRLLRVLKIFRRIKNTESVMAQRHVATISAMAVSSFVFVLLIMAGVGVFLESPTLDVTYQEGAVASLDYIVEAGLADAGHEADLARFAEAGPWVLAVEQGAAVRYARFDQATFDDRYDSDDYAFLERDGVALFIDLKPVNRDQAAVNLRYFTIIVASILVLMFLYSPHFAITISDPVHIMRRGMDERGYNLEILIPSEYRDDDIYRLARLYNEVYLPMKDRENATSEPEAGTTALSLDDVGGLFDEG